MADPKTLADRPIADRRGDDALDRHVPHVIDHPEPVVPEVETEAVAGADVGADETVSDQEEAD